MDDSDTRQSKADEISVELSSRRTGMSFQRTRMSADRTLMSVIRTSLSLISFGFTIFQVFEKLRDPGDLACRRAAQFRRRAGRARHRHAGRSASSTTSSSCWTCARSATR